MNIVQVTVAWYPFKGVLRHFKCILVLQAVRGCFAPRNFYYSVCDLFCFILKIAPFITAHVRSTRESTVITGVCLFTSRGRVPCPVDGEGGTPLSWWGCTPFSWQGVPQPRSGWGYPLPRRGGTPPGKGYPPAGVLPPPEQHSMYLLCGRRYGSCVQAGGLSCLW